MSSSINQREGEVMIEIVKASEDNLNDLVDMAFELWPDNDYEELKKEILDTWKHPDHEFFLAKTDEEYIGFVYVSMRNDYVEGSSSSPVGYLEGIYVKFNYRNKNIAKELVRVAEEWSKSKGCNQIGSDIEQDNYVSYDFHKRVGFEEANRLICFIKDI